MYALNRNSKAIPHPLVHMFPYFFTSYVFHPVVVSYPGSLCLVLLWLPHVRIDSRTKCCKGYASTNHSLRASILSQNTTGQATSRNAVGKIVLRAKSLDSAFDSREESADFAEVLGHGERASSHVFEADLELLSEWHGRDGLAGSVGDGGAERGIVGHLRNWVSTCCE